MIVKHRALDGECEVLLDEVSEHVDKINQRNKERLQAIADEDADSDNADVFALKQLQVNANLAKLLEENESELADLKNTAAEAAEVYERLTTSNSKKVNPIVHGMQPCHRNQMVKKAKNNGKCKECTFENAANSDRCDMCEKPFH